MKNDIDFSAAQNMCFVSGANMAGKSTALKAIGICVYLAHLGFPAPADAMQTCVFDGLYTTINLSDNILAGHSHFYREVVRIKDIALKLGSKRLLVIFDELFRGTNVKDAYDASVAIIKAFSGVPNSVFIISTHVIEAAEVLGDIKNLFFNCFTTTFQNQEPVYNYKLGPGLSKERLGMKIVHDSQLLEIVNAAGKGEN